VTKRERTDRDKQNWSNFSTYIKREDVTSEYQNRWSRPCSATTRTISAKTARFLQIRKNLLARKSKLTELLRAENEKFVAEMENIRHNSNRSEIESIKDRVEELRREKEMTRRSTAQERKMEMWRRDNPRIRSAHVERRRQEMVDIWSGQLEDRENEQREREEQRKRDRETLDREAEEARLQQKLQNDLRKKQQDELREQLARQMAELKAKECEQNRLKNLERQYLENEERLNQEGLRQKQKAMQKRQKEHRNMLFRQYRAQLLRRAHEIEEDLEQDLALLERIKHEEAQEIKLKDEKVREAQLCAQEAIELLRMKLKEEKEAQAEIEMLYRDQAEQWWEKRQAEWDSEQIARKQLLQDVLDDRRAQIKQNLENNRNHQREIISDRETLLHSIETDRQKALDEEKTTREKRKRLVDGLNLQLEERDERIRNEIDRDMLDELETAKTARQFGELELREEGAILAEPPTVRQAWR